MHIETIAALSRPERIAVLKEQMLAEPRYATIEQALIAIGRSMCSIESVSETRYLVDGEFMQTYGQVDISKPYN